MVEKASAIEKRQYSSKQMGDACEMLVAAELTLAGIPALKVPDNWPGYDVIAQPKNKSPLKISVKSRTFKQGPAFISYNNNDDFDWLAVVILPAGTQKERKIYLVPRNITDKHTRKDSAKAKTDESYLTILDFIHVFEKFEGNFNLHTDIEVKEKQKKGKAA